MGAVVGSIVPGAGTGDGASVGTAIGTGAGWLISSGLDALYDNQVHRGGGDDPGSHFKDNLGFWKWRYLLALFTRYVLVGRLEDGAQVFWDTLEKTPVKRKLDFGGDSGWARAGAAAGGAAAAAAPGLMVMIHGIARLLTPDTKTHHTHTDDVTLLAFLRPVTISRDAWNTYVAVAVMWLAGLLLYWGFCRLVFGRPNTYVPASLEDLAFASSMPATKLRYMFGGPIVGTLFLIAISGFPIAMTWMFWSNAQWVDTGRSTPDWIGWLAFFWAFLATCSPILLALRFVGPWDWRGRFSPHAGAERWSRLK